MHRNGAWLAHGAALVLYRPDYTLMTSFQKEEVGRGRTDAIMQTGRHRPGVDGSIEGIHRAMVRAGGLTVTGCSTMQIRPPATTDGPMLPSSQPFPRLLPCRKWLLRANALDELKSPMFGCWQAWQPGRRDSAMRQWLQR